MRRGGDRSNEVEMNFLKGFRSRRRSRLEGCLGYFHKSTRFAGFRCIDGNTHLASYAPVANVAKRFMKMFSRAQMGVLMMSLEVDNRNVVMVISLKKELIILMNGEVIDKKVYFALLRRCLSESRLTEILGSKRTL
jgi:hypothetical protein